MLFDVVFFISACRNLRQVFVGMFEIWNSTKSVSSREFDPTSKSGHFSVRTAYDVYYSIIVS